MSQWRRLWLVIAGTCLSLLLLSCAPFSASREEPPAAPWIVEANLYSGRRNPRGALTVEQGTELLAMMEALESSPPRETGGLGYSGFTLRPSQPAVTPIQSITVYDGSVAVTSANTTHYLADTERSVERWIFEQIENGAWLSGPEKQLIRNELPVDAGQ